jgi:hypothetical protein
VRSFIRRSFFLDLRVRDCLLSILDGLEIIFLCVLGKVLVLLKEIDILGELILCARPSAGGRRNSVR